MRDLAYVLSLLVLAGCSSSSEEGPAALDGGNVPLDGGSRAASATDGVKNGDETDVDCGGSSGAKCVVGKGCAKADDCDSAVCTSNVCAAPSATDGVKNGDETDVDCGGTSGKKCAPTKRCKVHADCSAEACLDGICSYAKSCRNHFGGATCGAGEPGMPGAQLEDCCTTVDVPRPDAQGGAFKMDKYLITAGRMRAFLTEVKSDVRSWAAQDPPRPDWNATWGKSVPASETDVAEQLGAGQSGATSYPDGSLGPGCYAKGMGAPAYWLPDDVQAANGDIARAFTQDELDLKVMNCATRALFTAFCHWDGGRLPKYDEWLYAVRGGDSAHTYPWGTDGAIGNYASYNFNYSWPRPLADKDLDRGAILPAPGRFPQGKGPFGHMDLAGAVENFGDDTGGGWMQYSFQEAGKEQYKIAYGTKRTNWGPSTRHWAVGARCVRPM